MPAPAVKVEIGLNLNQSDEIGFKLDDPVRGLLDNTIYTLSGERFYDITERLIDAQTQRGKSQALDRIDAGNATINFDNFDRLFDPLYEAGPYYGQLIPKRKIRISCNDYPVMFGFIDDLDIAYLPPNRSVVTVHLSDAFSQLADNNLPETSPDVELAGARVERILDLPTVNWSVNERQIDVGNTELSDATISEGTGVLSYLQQLAISEAGDVFVGKNGDFVFRERNRPPGLIDLVFTDESSVGTSTVIPFTNLGVIYGSENLYNRIVLTNDDPSFPNEAIAEDFESQGIYGPRSYTQNGLLTNSQEDLQFLADFLLARFKEPQYRFESLTLSLDTISESQQNEVLDLEIGNIVQVRFTPSGIPPVIEQYCKVIGIRHDWSNSEKQMTLALERLDFALFILDDVVFGILDEDQLSY
jgi:hypothetical protein